MKLQKPSISLFFNEIDNAATPVERHHYLLLSIIAPMFAVILLFFSVYNFWVLERPLIGYLTASLGVSFAFSYVYFKRMKQLSLPITVLISSVAVFLYFFNVENKNEGFGLVWTVLFPVLALHLLGRKKGLYLVVIFYIVMLFPLLEGLNVWQESAWDKTSFIRFSVGYFLLTYFIYGFESTSNTTYAQLQDIREKELEHVKALEVLTITDPLTGAFNRRHLSSEAAELSGKLQSQYKNMVFFILDVDNFKAFNDQYGHQKGDAALVAVSKALSSHIEPSFGKLFRVGGEEFAGIIFAEHVENVLLDIERMLNSINNIKLDGVESTYVLSASAGVFMTSTMNGLSFDDIYRMADQACYQAKEGGKNQVVLHRRKT